MNLDTYNQQLKNLTSQLTKVMDQLDATDPEKELALYEERTGAMIEIQANLNLLDIQYNAERKQ